MDGSAEDDGLKWFGEGFDGFPKRLPDDCVEYAVYVVNAELTDTAATRKRLKEILKGSIDLSTKLLKDYIWQRDGFGLQWKPDRAPDKVRSTDKTHADDMGVPPHLQGRTNFGDSVADEWLVVYLLLELSKQFSDAWIRVYDTDGEFLLIEAAKALPKWLNPDNAEHRVWISNGHLRIIPLPEGLLPPTTSLAESLDFIRRRPDKLLISPLVEDEAFFRLRSYPSAISSSIHHAFVTIPRRLAFLLHRNPAYISPAIEAFYLRDPVSLRPLSTQDVSALHLPPHDLVAVSVRFTKVGYAQLRSQVFDPPPAWTEIAPRMKDSKAELGMKVSCGFEMMLSDPQNQDKRVVREVRLLLDDIDGGHEVLPSDADFAMWPATQDDEKWLDIDFNDFEKELSGRTADKEKTLGKGFGDASAQESLRKMVSRFEDFLEDEDAGAEGVDEDSGGENDESEDSEDAQSEINEDEFKNAMNHTWGMSPQDLENTGLLDEARKLALEDAEDRSHVDEDEEMEKVMALMEQELKGHGALDLNGKTSNNPQSSKGKPVFGPERPPHMQNTSVASTTASHSNVEDEDDVGPGDGELSSDDEDFNDIDLGLAKNMLESFKGQAGLAGPAGNLMRAMGINLPRDEGSSARH